MLQTLGELEAARHVDRLAIYTRGNVVLYENTCRSIGWSREPSVRQVVDAERTHACRKDTFGSRQAAAPRARGATSTRTCSRSRGALASGVVTRCCGEVCSSSPVPRREPTPDAGCSLFRSLLRLACSSLPQTGGSCAWCCSAGAARPARTDRCVACVDSWRRRAPHRTGGSLVALSRASSRSSASNATGKLAFEKISAYKQDSFFSRKSKERPLGA
jgi:hypothetical protein